MPQIRNRRSKEQKLADAFGPILNRLEPEWRDNLDSAAPTRRQLAAEALAKIESDECTDLYQAALRVLGEHNITITTAEQRRLFHALLTSDQEQAYKMYVLDVIGRSPYNPAAMDFFNRLFGKLLILTRSTMSFEAVRKIVQDIHHDIQSGSSYKTALEWNLSHNNFELFMVSSAERLDREREQLTGRTVVTINVPTNLTRYTNDLSGVITAAWYRFIIDNVPPEDRPGTITVEVDERDDRGNPLDRFGPIRRMYEWDQTTQQFYRKPNSS